MIVNIFKGFKFIFFFFLENIDIDPRIFTLNVVV